MAPTLRTVRNTDRYTTCSSCRASAAILFVWQYGTDGSAPAAGACRRHAELWARRTKERGAPAETYEQYQVMVEELHAQRLAASRARIAQEGGQ